MRPVVNNHRFLNSCGTLCLFAFLLAIFLPAIALAQSRVWSTSRGIAGARVGAAPARQNYTGVTSLVPSDQKPSSNGKIAEEPKARASLRYDWDGETDENDKTPNRKSFPVPAHGQGTTVKLFIDARTDAQLRRLSAYTGIPYGELLYRYLRIGHTVFTEKLSRGEY